MNTASSNNNELEVLNRSHNGWPAQTTVLLPPPRRDLISHTHMVNKRSGNCRTNALGIRHPDLEI